MPTLSITQWGLIGLFVALLGLGVAYKVQGAHLETAKAAKKTAEDDRDKWQSNATTANTLALQNAQAITDLANLTKARDAAAETMRLKLAAMAKDMNKLREDIRNAPPEDDGLISPVLRSALNGVRGQTPGAPSIHP